MLTHEELKGELPMFEELSLDPNCVGDVLKLWVRELRYPLLPHHLYDRAINKVASLEKAYLSNPHEKVNNKDHLPDYENFCIFLKDELHIPERNFNTLIYICKYILEVASKSDLNRMTKSNLAIIWGATVFRKINDSNDELQIRMFELFLDIAQNSV